MNEAPPLKPHEMLLIAVVVLVVYLPFVTKGVTNDDPIFLDYAARLTLDPTRCITVDYVFQGKIFEDFVVFESSHPPFVPYVIRAVTSIFGQCTIALHTTFAIFPLLAALALGGLIRIYTGHSPYLALAVVAGPLFLPNATSLMADVPLFALWTSTLLLFEWAMKSQERKHKVLLALCAFFAFCAYFTAYQGLGLIALLFLAGLHHQRQGKALLVIACSLAPFGLWLLGVWLRYDIFPYLTQPREELSIAGEVAKGLAVEGMLPKARMIALYTGTALFFFAPLIPKTHKHYLLAILALAGWAFLALPGPLAEWNYPARIAPLLLVCAGLAFTAPLYNTIQGLAKSEHRCRHALLSSWAAGFLVFQIAIAPFASPRYLLPLFGALILMLLQQLPKQKATTLAIATTLTVALGIAVAWAEKDYANAMDINRLELCLEEPYHFVGEMGIEYSGEQAGHIYYRPGLEDEVGQMLVPTVTDRIAIEESLRELAEAVHVVEIYSSLPIRVVDPERDANFYLHTRGSMPFIWGTGPVETYTLYRFWRQANPHWPGPQPGAYAPAGPILPESPVIQEFTSTWNGLEKIEIMFATYARENTSRLNVTLWDQNPENPTVVFSQAIDTSILADNTWQTFTFPSQANAKNKTYRLELSSPDATPTNAVTVWVNTQTQTTHQYGQQTKPGALQLKAFCLP